MARPEVEVREELARRGIVRQVGAAYRTTRRWQSAMARAALRLLKMGVDGDDLRVPIAAALYELCGDLADERMAELVEALVPIEVAELSPAK